MSGGGGDEKDGEVLSNCFHPSSDHVLGVRGGWWAIGFHENDSKRRLRGPARCQRALNTVEYRRDRKGPVHAPFPASSRLRSRRIR